MAAAVPLNYSIETTVPAYNFDAAILKEVPGSLSVMPGARNVARPVRYVANTPLYTADSAQ